MTTTALVELPSDINWLTVSKSGMRGWRCRYCGQGRIFKGAVREEAAEARVHEATCSQRR